jgi:four helix bundle protein
MKDYKELDLWKESRKLVSFVYRLTADFPSEEKFGLKSQLQRAAVSVPSNIAEGMGRQSSPDTQRFLVIARGSLFELETQLYLCVDLGVISDQEMKLANEQVILCLRLLSGYLNYLKSK